MFLASQQDNFTFDGFQKMKNRRFLPAWQCDSADDYYAQFEQKKEPEDDPDDLDNGQFVEQDIRYHNGDRG